VLSRTRVVVLVAMVVAALGIGLMGTVGSASPEDDDGHNNSDKGRSTLTVVSKTPEIEDVDLDPQGPTHGDIRVTNAPLYNATGAKRIGRLDLFCVITDPADESAEKAHIAECMKTFTLPGGEISSQGSQGVEVDPELSGDPSRGVDAISGGTGKYAGVRGEQRFEMRGNKVINTFYFID
jgi:hypothetical protein